MLQICVSTGLWRSFSLENICREWPSSGCLRLWKILKNLPYIRRQNRYVSATNLWKVSPAFLRLNIMNGNSYKLNSVAICVFGISCGLSGIWLYAFSFIHSLKLLLDDLSRSSWCAMYWRTAMYCSDVVYCVMASLLWYAVWWSISGQSRRMLWLLIL